MDKKISSLLVLSQLRSIGPRPLLQLLNGFSSAAEALAAGPPAWVSTLGLPPSAVPDLEKELELAWPAAEKEERAVLEKGIRLVAMDGADFPALLREIPVPPVLLYIKGPGLSSPGPLLSLVGSRRSTFYGARMARAISGEMAERGVVTVSGLARGIDSHVHTQTLESGGITWAVVGHGLGTVYPKENARLFDRIAERGAVISEFPIHTAPHPALFPRRNRIIAGVSIGTVVIEGGETSGSLITARLAAEFGRDVFAVPGPVGSPTSAAPHRLIKSGACLVESARDILVELGLVEREETTRAAKKSDLADLSVETKKVWEALEHEPVSREVIAARAGLPASTVMQSIFDLEIRGIVVALSGGFVVRR